MGDNPYQYTIKVNKSKEGETDIYNITWNIPRIKVLLETKAMAGYRTPRYTVVKVPDTPFQLKVGFFGLRPDFMEVYYLTTTSSFIKLSLKFTTNLNFERDVSVDYQAVQANEWQHSAVLHDLVSIAKSNSNQPLLMYFKFTVSQGIRVVCHNIPLPHTPQLSEDLGTLLTDTGSSDVTMKSVEGIELRVHKNILSARSKVMRANFEHNTKESITNVVETPWETEVLRDVLTFVYTDKAPRVKDAPDKLLIAADYYQLDRLKSLCAEALNNRLTVENAVDTLQLAELYSLSYLRLSTLNYIQNDRLKLVKETQGWKNIKSVEFIQRIYDFIFADQINKIDILAVAFNELGQK